MNVDYYEYSERLPEFEVEATIPPPMGFIGFIKLKEVPKPRYRIKARGHVL